MIAQTGRKEKGGAAMRLETARLVLAEWEPAMAAALCALSQDPENRRFLPDEVFETPEEADAAICRLLQYRRTGGGAQVLAVLQKDGALAGHVELVPCRSRPGHGRRAIISARLTGGGAMPRKRWRPFCRPCCRRWACGRSLGSARCPMARPAGCWSAAASGFAFKSRRRSTDARS